jgi:hypothetical protein
VSLTGTERLYTAFDRVYGGWRGRLLGNCHGGVGS